MSSLHHRLKGICHPKNSSDPPHLVQNPDFTGSGNEACYELNCIFDPKRYVEDLTPSTSE